MKQAPGGVLRRLAEWQQAGLVTSELASRIAAYEAARRKPALLYAVFGLGAFAVVVGIVAIIAANWAYISGGLKISIDLAFCALLAFLVVRPPGGREGFARETAIVMLFGITLASIGLIAQVYNLGGKPWQALATWLVLTTALVFHGRGQFLAGLWGIAASTTIAYWLMDFIKNSHVSDRVGMELAFAAVTLVPIGLIALGELGLLERAKPVFARAFRKLGWLEAIAAGLGGQLVWYANTTRETLERPWWALLVATAALLGLAFGRPRSTSSRALLVFTLVGAVVPMFLPHEKVSWLAALSFIALWVLVAWDAYGEGSSTVLNIATALVAVRIVIVYIEVFGSLMSTGISLLSGGLLTIGLAALWVRQSRKFREELQ